MRSAEPLSPPPPSTAPAPALQRAYRRRAARDVVPASLRLDTFVGRGTELTELTKLLARNRIVTVTGPPGVGKSRLVHEAVAHRRHVMVIELADVTRVPDLLANGPEPGLLVLDGCEPVLGLAARTSSPGTPRSASSRRAANR